jgi:hypothetical protein
MKPTKAQRLDEVCEMMEKYCSLVWLARSSPDPNSDQWADTPNEIFLKAFEQQEVVRSKYPIDVKELSSDDSDFHHGFNSGMLAGLRYAVEMMTGDVKFASENFPDLDT